MPLTQEMIDDFVGVSHGDFEKVQDMLNQYPGLLNAVSSWKETPLGAAAHMARFDIAEYLLSAGAPLDICTAAMLGEREQVEAFLRADPFANDAKGAHDFPVMFYPAISGRIDIAELLLAYRASVSTGEGTSTPLHGAAMFGQKEMIIWLLNHSAPLYALNYDNKTPLEVAMENGHEDIVSLLEQHMVSNSEGPYGA
jgi:uncharacterized protein